LGPFEDCTSNQAIALAELKKPKHKDLIIQSVALAKKLTPLFPGITWDGLAVEIATIKLQIEISHHITGLVHVQINPKYAYNENRVCVAAKRIIELFKHVDDSFDISRVCVKIPATWEALQACRKLEASGILTLATTVFCFHQVALAGEVNCKYIAPYVNRLAVHFSDVKDTAPSFDLCFYAQRYFEHNRNRMKTKVLAASLTSAEEIMRLRGVDHITIPPSLLELLPTTRFQAPDQISLFDEKRWPDVTVLPPYDPPREDFETGLRSTDAADAHQKLEEALKIFTMTQDKLQILMANTASANVPSEAECV
jgi:transaldolase